LQNKLKELKSKYPDGYRQIADEVNCDESSLDENKLQSLVNGLSTIIKHLEINRAKLIVSKCPEASLELYGINKHSLISQTQAQMILSNQSKLESKQQDIDRKKNLAQKFKYSNIYQYKVAYWCDYYPTKRFPSVNSEADSNRKAIWAFKDGEYSIGVEKAVEFIDGNFTTEQMRNMVLCVIPASTQYKNEIRYKTFCQKVSNKLGLINGYNYISILYDRCDSRKQKSSNTTENLSFSDDVSGKDVVLFDDLSTRGASFFQAATKLKEKGARSVYGFFLGKTVHF